MGAFLVEKIAELRLRDARAFLLILGRYERVIGS